MGMMLSLLLLAIGFSVFGVSMVLQLALMLAGNRVSTRLSILDSAALITFIVGACGVIYNVVSFIAAFL